MRGATELFMIQWTSHVMSRGANDVDADLNGKKFKSAQRKTFA